MLSQIHSKEKSHEYPRCFDYWRTNRYRTCHRTRLRARIVVSGRHDEEGKKLVAEIRKLGTEAEFVRSDVRHEEDVRSLVDKTIELFGRLDVAVNAAGTEGVPGPVSDQTAESYAATFDTNVLGTLLSMKQELRVMQAQGHGCVVNLSSTTGSKAAPGAPVYTASKHADITVFQDHLGDTAKDELFEQADILTIHLVLSGRTRSLVGAAELALMKSTARLINTSRGPIVDEQASGSPISSLQALLDKLGIAHGLGRSTSYHRKEFAT